MDFVAAYSELRSLIATPSRLTKKQEGSAPITRLGPPGLSTNPTKPILERLAELRLFGACLAEIGWLSMTAGRSAELIIPLNDNYWVMLL